jgi:hypothetical protein
MVRTVASYDIKKSDALAFVKHLYEQEEKHGDVQHKYACPSKGAT